MSLAECHNAECHYAECLYAKCRYAECHNLIIVMLNGIILSVTMLNVIMVSVVMPNDIVLSVSCHCTTTPSSVYFINKLARSHLCNKTTRLNKTH